MRPLMEDLSIFNKFIFDYAFNSAYVMVELFTQAVRIRSNI
jgi:hypothetical protein